MINKFRKIYTDVKIKFVLKRGFSPTKDEMNKARNLFLVEVEARFPFTEQPKPSRFLQYTLAAIAGVFILNSGAVIYADTYDVPTTHPLYTYKRVAEEVKVLTSTSARQPEIEVKIAQRRVKELKQIQAFMHINASSTATTTHSTSSKTSESNTKAQLKLQHRLKKHIQSVENNIYNSEVSRQAIKKELICKELEVVHTDIEILFNNNADRDEIQAKIVKMCRTDEQEQSVPTNDQTQSTPQIKITPKNLPAKVKMKPDIKKEVKNKPPAETEAQVDVKTKENIKVDEGSKKIERTSSFKLDGNTRVEVNPLQNTVINSTIEGILGN